MDKKLFEQLLTEVAEWRIPKTLGEISQPKKPRQTKIKQHIDDELTDDEHTDHELDFLAQHGGINPTYPPQLVKVKVQACECSDCGRYCSEGRQVDKKIYVANNIRHWREYCKTCAMTRNPYTKKFDLRGGAASMTWNNYLRYLREKKSTTKNDHE
jgi:hypothetical protein